MSPILPDTHNYRTILTRLLSLSFVLLGLTITSCYDDPISDSSDIPLAFSLDTLRFDTVFTTAGSATRSFKIYNPLEEAVIIDAISLRQGAGFFRINANGITGPVAKDIRIEPLDSIYVFAEVTIDPDLPLSISPFIVEDIIDIRVNESEYAIYLEAWGQNANYVPNRQSGGRVNYISCDLDQWRWDDPRPYVIYGALIIDSCELVIPAGQKVYVHGGVAINDLGVYNDGLLVFLSKGNLTIEGTAEEPVIFSSDRLEEPFREVPGQWGGIIFNAGSRDNLLRHTKIYHAISGLTVDSSSLLRLEQCEIGLTSGNGITAAHAGIYAQNCLFFQNGGNSVRLGYGGGYVFNYCTFVNLDNQQSAVALNNFRCTDALCQGPVLLNPLFAEFNNCIIVGNDRDEISLADATDGTDPNAFIYRFNNSIVSVEDILAPDAWPGFFDNCNDCLNVTGPDSLFINVEGFDFHLDTLSRAIDFGNPIPPIESDLDGLPREALSPDAGAYEFQK